MPICVFLFYFYLNLRVGVVRGNTSPLFGVLCASCARFKKKSMPGHQA